MKKLLLLMLIPTVVHAEPFKDKWGRTCINVPYWQTATFKGRPVNELGFNNGEGVTVRCTRRMRSITVSWPSHSICLRDYIVGDSYTCRVRALNRPLKNDGKTLKSGAIDFGDPRRWR